MNRTHSSQSNHPYPTVDPPALYRMIDEKPPLDTYVSPFDINNQSNSQTTNQTNNESNMIHKYKISPHETIKILKSMLQTAGINPNDIDWTAQPLSRPVTAASRPTTSSVKQTPSPVCGLNREQFRHVVTQYVNKLMVRLPSVIEQYELKVSGAPPPEEPKFVPLPRKQTAPTNQTIDQPVEPINVENIEQHSSSKSNSQMDSARSERSIACTDSARSRTSQTANNDGHSMEIVVTDQLNHSTNHSKQATASLDDSFVVKQSVTSSTAQPSVESTSPSYSSVALMQVQSEIAPFVTDAAIAQLADSLFLQLDENKDSYIDVFEFGGFLGSIDRSIGMELRLACRRALITPQVDKILSL